MRAYIVPPDVDVATLRVKADRRREALVAFGCSTYSTGFKRDEGECIVCLCCGLGSAHPDDIRIKYCGFCNAYHSEEQVA